MKTYLALFRGINVGGNNILPMKELVELLRNVGLENITTYIQSGNVVFTSKEKDAGGLPARIIAAIKTKYGFDPAILLLEPGDLEAAISNNPFPEAQSDPKSLHLGFLASKPEKPDLEKLEALRRGSERFKLIDRIFYLNAPEGVGKSKLAANAEKALGVPMTDRNWRTVCTLRDMARGIGG